MNMVNGLVSSMTSSISTRCPDDFCFSEIADPRRAQGRRRRLPTVLAIAAGASLRGMRDYKATALGPEASAPRRASTSAIGVISADALLT